MILLTGDSTLGFAHVSQCSLFHFDLAQHWPLKLSKLKELSAHALGFTTYNGLIAAIKHQPVWFDANLWHQSLIELAHTRHGLDKTRLSVASELFAEHHLSDDHACYFKPNSRHYIEFTMQITGLSGMALEEETDNRRTLPHDFDDESEIAGLSVVDYLQKHFPYLARKISKENRVSLNFTHHLTTENDSDWELPLSAFDEHDHVLVLGSYAPYEAEEGLALSGLSKVFVRLTSALADDEIAELTSHRLSKSGEHFSSSEPYLEAMQFEAKGLILEMMPISIMHDELLSFPKSEDHFVHPFLLNDALNDVELANESNLSLTKWATRLVIPQLLRPYLFVSDVVMCALDDADELIHSSISWEKGRMEVTRPRLPDLVRAFNDDWASEPFDDLLSSCNCLQQQLVVEPEITLKLSGQTYPSYSISPLVNLIVHSAPDLPTSPLNNITLAEWFLAHQVKQLNYVDLLHSNNGDMLDNLFVGSDELGNEKVRFEIMSLFGFDPSWHEALSILKAAVPKGVYHNDSFEEPLVK